MAESLAELGFVTVPAVHAGAVGSPPAVLSGGLAVLNQSLMQVALVQVPMSTVLAGVWPVLTLVPAGAPPLGPGLVWEPSAAMPLDMTMSRDPLSGCTPAPKLGRMLRARASPSGDPSARWIWALM